jgi:hypothetical protein
MACLNRIVVTSYSIDLAPLSLNSTHSSAASMAILSEFAASFEVFRLSR